MPNNELKDKAYEWLNFLNTDERMIKAINEGKESAALIRDLNYEYAVKEYLSCINSENRERFNTKHIVVDACVQDIIPMYKGNELAVLNYGSFKNPGGRFLQGDMAQEEALCHVTGLFPILEEKFNVRYYLYNRGNLNHGQYNHSFVAALVPYLINNNFGTCYIITGSAPNFISAKRYGYRAYSGITEETMKQAMWERQELVYLIAGVLGVKYFVAGPWGCGVFKNDPYHVAEGWKRCVNKYPGLFKEVIHTCPDKNSNNYKAFMEVLK